jgi:hypothetical protein
MSTISNIGKIAYIYNQQTDTWHPIAGMTDTSSDFSWTGDHEFSEEVEFDGGIVSNSAVLVKNAFNYFESTAARNSAISSPVNGSIAFVVNEGTLQPQVYYEGRWNLYSSNANLLSKTGNHTIELSDAGKTLDFTSASALTVTVPLDSVVNFPLGSQIAFIQSGAGQILFSGQTSEGASVTIDSKNNNKRTATRYTHSIIVKKAANRWYLFGDLTA